MFIDTYADRIIGEKIKLENEIERQNHIASGKLTASMLGEPLQWQILKVLGVKPKEIDEYTLRKFKRGKDIETWFVDHISPLDKQKPVEYRSCVGVIDAVVDSDIWDCRKGVIPIEVKSTSNAKFKRIVKGVKPDRGHVLQACFYALAEGKEWFAVSYVATDDLRVHTFVMSTADHKEEVERVIDRFKAQYNTGIIPAFVAEEKWQENIKYCKYPEFMTMPETKFESFKQSYNL